MFNIFVSILIFLFGPNFKKLGNEDFDIREKEQQSMIKLFPLNLAGIIQGSCSQDAEIKFQCKQLINKNKFINASRKLYTITCNSTEVCSLLFSHKLYSVKEAKELLNNPEEWSKFVFICYILQLYDPKNEVLSIDYIDGCYQMMWARMVCKKNNISFEYKNVWPLPKDWQLE